MEAAIFPVYFVRFNAAWPVAMPYGREMVILSRVPRDPSVDIRQMLGAFHFTITPYFQWLDSSRDIDAGPFTL